MIPNGFDPDRMFAELEKAAEERAEAEYFAHLLEKNGEIIIAELTVKAKQDGHAIGICKDIARSDPKWKVHVEGEAEAIRRRSRARARLENLRALADARRTMEASARALTR